MSIKNLTKSQLLQKQRRRQRCGRDQEWRQGRQLRSFLAAIDQPRLGEDFDSNSAFFESALPITATIWSTFEKYKHIKCLASEYEVFIR